MTSKTTTTKPPAEDRVMAAESEVAKIRSAKEDILTALTSFSSRKRAALEASDVEAVTRLNSEREVLNAKKITIEVDLYNARVALEELKALIAEEQLPAAEEKQAQLAVSRDEAERQAREAQNAYMLLRETRRTALERAETLRRQLNDYLHAQSAETKSHEAPVVRSLPHLPAEAS